MGIFRHIIEAMESTPLTLAQVAALGDEGRMQLLTAYEAMRKLDKETAHASEVKSTTVSNLESAILPVAEPSSSAAVPALIQDQTEADEAVVSTSSDVLPDDVIESDDEFLCLDCGKQCASKAGLKSHIRGSHREPEAVDSISEKSEKVIVHNGFEPLRPVSERIQVLR